MGTDGSNLIVAKFENQDQAEQALGQVEQVLKATGSKLDEGTLVARDAAGEVKVVDLKDTAMSDIIANAADLTLYLALGTVKIAFSTAVSGLALLMESTGRFASLLGSVALFPVKKISRLFFSTDALERLGITLDPGNAAVVIQVAERHLATLQDALKTAGGEIVGVTQLDRGLLEGAQAAASAAADEAADTATDLVQDLSDMAADVTDTLADAADDAVESTLDATRAMTVDAALAMPSMDELEDRKVSQNLTEIEGIGPVISAALEAQGIRSFTDLAGTDVARLRTILADAGIGADPETWPRQARLAMRGHWNELRALQERLQGGREA
jgi:predicted flap endonuclease-1-like 5' DNA nuclease